MVSGSYKGAGININDWLVVGALAVGGYFLYKMIIKPTSEVTGAAGSISKDTSSVFHTLTGESTETYTIISDKIQSFLKSIGGSGSSEQQPLRDNLITQPVTALNPVSKIDITGTAYGMPTHTIKNSSGQSSTIIVAPNTYYKDLGVGFNAAGQGYSSAFAGNKQPTTSLFTKGNPFTL